MAITVAYDIRKTPLAEAYDAVLKKKQESLPEYQRLLWLSRQMDPKNKDIPKPPNV